MAKNILKEAIADAKAVREVALANAKAALEEAFTPKLQSMLSAKLSETLNEEDEELEETYIEEAPVAEITGMDEKDDLDEEIDLEEILNELELEEEDDSEQEDVEATDDGAEDEELEEANNTPDKPNYKASDVGDTFNNGSDVHQGLNEGGEFDLDALLEEINSLDETEDEVNEEVEETNEWSFNSAKSAPDKTFSNQLRAFIKDSSSYEDWQSKVKEFWTKGAEEKRPNWPAATAAAAMIKSDEWKKEFETNKVAEEGMYETLEKELDETKAALEVKTTELNEVNLLNSKLLYVNRIFKANQLDQGQKLRVVETLDKADSIKEAKLIYETIKDTFNVAKSKKASFQKRTKSLKEGIGMASKAAGTSTAPKKEVITESNDMVNRFQKLANIKIN